VYNMSELIVKVKEPIEIEYPLLKEKHIIFAYLHLSSNKKLVKALLDSKCTCVAYETIEKDGEFPLLAPMSEVAGKMAAIIGACYLSAQFGGRGLLIGGVTGVLPARVLILGAGVVAKSAAKIAAGMGAEVIIMSPFIDELRKIELSNYLCPNVFTKMMSYYNILEEVKKADIVISAIYVKGSKTPILVTEEMVAQMKKGSVIVAVDIDQGSSIETAYPTTHEDPIYIKHGVIHYCVANMPGVFPRTSTLSLTNLSLPYIKKIAKSGFESIKNDKELLSGLNIYNGKIVYKKVAEDVGMMEKYSNIL
ncbi:MAG: alanine dehydrogenase, partial [Actinobacteria bacterium]|nr:alanine dehydrogenase [Actinomycetota bacterium]